MLGSEDWVALAQMWVYGNKLMKVKLNFKKQQHDTMNNICDLYLGTVAALMLTMD